MHPRMPPFEFYRQALVDGQTVRATMREIRRQYTRNSSFGARTGPTNSLVTPPPTTTVSAEDHECVIPVVMAVENRRGCTLTKWVQIDPSHWQRRSSRGAGLQAWKGLVCRRRVRGIRI